MQFIAHGLQRRSPLHQLRIILQRQGNFRIPHALFDFFILFGSFGLAGNGIELRFDFFDDVVQPLDIYFCCLHFTDSSIFTAFVFGDSRGVFDKQSSIFRLRFHHIGHAALLDQRVGPRADAGAHKEFLDVQETTGHAINEIFAVSIEDNSPGNGHLRHFRICAGKTLAVCRQRHGDFRHTHRGSILAAIENNVVHLLSAQRLYPLLAHNPANGVNDVRFSAAVRTDDGCYALGKIENDFIAE